MRVLMVGIVCLAVGFGAGWAVFERPWESDPKPAHVFTIASIEDAVKTVGSHVRDVSCGSVHGPFYSCRAYTSANGGADYSITVTRSGRCLDATRDDSSTEDEMLDDLDADAFKLDHKLPVTFRAWLTSRADC